MSEPNRDEAADKIFGHPYNQLSAWGQLHVDRVLAKFARADLPRNVTIGSLDDPITLKRECERLSRELDRSRVEALELWDEISELKQELSQLRSEFNPPSSS